MGNKGRMPRNAKRDDNEKAIVAALKECGVYVLKISAPGSPDLALYAQGRWFLVDVKAKKGKATDLQDWDETIAPGAVPFVRTLEEALIVVGLLHD